MTWLLTLVLLYALNSLAVHRINRLVLDDKISEPFRNWVFKRYGQPHLTWTYLFTCPWCVSIWAAALAVAGTLFFPLLWLPVASILALSLSGTATYIKLEERTH